MKPFEEFLQHSDNLRAFIMSILMLILIQMARLLINRGIDRNNDVNPIDRIAYKKTSRNYLNILYVFLLFAIWFSQIQSVFVSLFAVAAAIVLATKELIMSFMGGFLIKINNYYRLGDRIEIDGVRGFVIEKNLTVTKLLEIGPEKNTQQTTGDMVAIPNSIFLTKSMKNESYFRDYSIKAFTLKLPPGVSLDTFEQALLGWGHEICDSYLEEAQKIIGSFCKKEGLMTPTVEPRSKIYLTEKNEIMLLLKIPVRNHLVGEIEQDIYRRYVNYLSALEKNGSKEIEIAK